MGYGGLLQFLPHFVQIIRLDFFVIYSISELYNLNVSFGDETDNSFYLAGHMSNLFSYFDGSLEDFLAYIKDKVRLASVESFCHVLDNFAVKHIVTKHSNDKEVLRGQIKIQESDFLLIPDIVVNFDSCLINTPRPGRTLITYSKTYDDCLYTYVEEIRKGRHELAGLTFYKRKRKLTDAKSPADSADSGFASFSEKTHRRKELNSAISGFVLTAKVSKYPQIPNLSFKILSLCLKNFTFSQRWGSWPPAVMSRRSASFAFPST